MDVSVGKLVYLKSTPEEDESFIAGVYLIVREDEEFVYFDRNCYDDTHNFCRLFKRWVHYDEKDKFQDTSDKILRTRPICDYMENVGE